ncbi:unnamed protein product [Lathyrus oleraceus]
MSRGIENLNIHNEITLPPSILSCKTLKVLKLNELIVNGFSHQVDFPVLKILHLKRMSFESHELVVKLLSGCPIIEELQTKDLYILKDSFVPEKEFDGLLLSLIKARISFDDYIFRAVVISTQFRQRNNFRSCSICWRMFSRRSWEKIHLF